MANIHPTAIIHPTAEIADDVEIGPYCLVGERAVIGKGTRLEAHVVVDSWTVLGESNHLFWGVIVGAPPQDRKYKDEPTCLKIGNHNVIREYVTLHRASGEGEETLIGDHNFFMAYSHVGHNSRVGSHVVMANSVGIGGHSVIEDYVNFGGLVGVHQFTTIGAYAMIGGMSRVNRDAPPYMLIEGSPFKVYGINSIGLQRAGFSQETRDTLKTACRLLYYSNLKFAQAIEKIRAELPAIPEIEHLIESLEASRLGRNGRALDRR